MVLPQCLLCLLTGLVLRHGTSSVFVVFIDRVSSASWYFFSVFVVFTDRVSSASWYYLNVFVVFY